MSTRPILGRDVYLALAAIGWADGQLTQEGADAIVHAALEEGLDLEDIAEIEAATKNRVELGQIDRYLMTKADRLYVYAVAAWIAEIDGKRSPEVEAALGTLGDALRIPEKPRRRTAEILQRVAAEADRPERLDFAALRRTLDAQLTAAEHLRKARDASIDD